MTLPGSNEQSGSDAIYTLEFVPLARYNVRRLGFIVLASGYRQSGMRGALADRQHDADAQPTALTVPERNFAAVLEYDRAHGGQT